jgi:sarcosine oxidase/L-pipecolate oxidase
MRKNPKRFWSVYKNKKKSPSIPTTVASEAFNTYFHSVISLDDSSISHLHEVQQTCDLTASDKLLNKSISSGTFPQQWKEAVVVPIHKKGDRNFVTNYRPISLLCILSKVLHSLSEHQHGSLKGHSTITQMLCFLHKIGKARDKASQTDIIYLDLSKAFDSVSHSRLLFKLHSAGIKGCLFSWLSDYLANRTQRVLVKGCTSKPLPVTSGVPQGSILGPLLFIWYINYLPDAVSNDTLVYLFADDTKLARIINSR